MRALRASAVVLPRASDNGGGGGAISGLGADLVMPSFSPYLHRTGSASPIVVASPTYAYASVEVRPACMEGLKTDHPCLASEHDTSHTFPVFPSIPGILPRRRLRWSAQLSPALRRRLAAGLATSSSAGRGVRAAPASAAASAPAPAPAPAGINASACSTVAAPVDHVKGPTGGGHEFVIMYNRKAQEKI